jgi:hypothetical protein
VRVSIDRKQDMRFEIFSPLVLGAELDAGSAVTKNLRGPIRGDRGVDTTTGMTSYCYFY